MRDKGVLTKNNMVALAAVFTVAGVVYCLISLVNHYLFKTYALDLGLYTNAMYDYAHFRMDDCSMFLTEPRSVLSAHFDLYLVLLSPLVYIFGSYTLLVVQIAAVLLGGWGIYKLIGLYTDDHRMPLLAVTVVIGIQPDKFIDAPTTQQHGGNLDDEQCIGSKDVDQR